MTKHRLGIDIGSTTAKIALLDEKGKLLFKRYQRHNTEVEAVILEILAQGRKEFPSLSFRPKITGTAGMGLSERCGIPFTQEVIASAEVIKQQHPEVRMLIDLGGEDSKLIFFGNPLKPDIRMNGNCAGGTGAFIDQMAVLLGLNLAELNEAASRSSIIYPIASRCGVFAKTDIQNLIARDIPREDIAASIYQAVAYQVINTLGRGTALMPKVIFAGGPLTFSSQLRKAFIKVLELDEEDLFTPENPELLPAMGAALLTEEGERSHSFDSLIQLISQSDAAGGDKSDRLPPLFGQDLDFEAWEKEKNCHSGAEVSLARGAEGPLFLGIDSGSTTTKIVLLDKEGRLAARHYRNNRGNPIQAVKEGLEKIGADAEKQGLALNIARSGVTGYGEDLIQFAFGVDEGHVETIAHFRGAQYFDPEVSFILDIGGQDMKAMFIQNGIISNMELNEACSSGCGSFIETFANSLNMSVQEFSRAACLDAPHPCDLGTRCTVFMNSRVKQSLREGASKGEISAGLAYSVIKNCFNKVLKLTDYSLLGDHIVVQGGTFRNQAILRATELILGRKVTRPPHSELMGAWGAAMIARDAWKKETSSSHFIGLNHLDKALRYERKRLLCRGCENKCQVTRLSFRENGKIRHFFAGNKCEKIFSNRLKGSRTGTNMHELKRELLFKRPLTPAEGKSGSAMRIGIPRVLNMWDDFPFWATLFTACGMEVVLSDPSSMELASKGYGTVMSENICFPAKLTNGHIFNLIDKKVDRIFYPMVRYSREEFEGAVNVYNCPVVTGYPQVIESSINPEERGIPFDRPPVSFAAKSLIRKFCWSYLKTFGVSKDCFRKAFRQALAAQEEYRTKVRQTGARIMEQARKEGRRVILVLGRPYHVDALISHKMGEMITALGLDLITEDSIPLDSRSSLYDVKVLTQWTFPNRLYEAALWAGEQKNVEVLQLNSFGCGPDALSVDEVKPLLNRYGKNPTLVKIDEITSPGSVKLRIRSLIESLKLRGEDYTPRQMERENVAVFGTLDKSRKILAPMFSPFYTDFLVSSFRKAGYDLEILPMPDKASIETGLKYSNNDICYPATIVIGDLIKALQSGRYDLANVAVGLTQTGGQCRASSYVSMLKKAMIRSGYPHVPVVTISTHKEGPRALNPQPGFRIPANFRLDSFFGVIFADALARLYYSHACREKVKGSAWTLTEKYLKTGKDLVDYRQPGKLYRLLEAAIPEFDTLDIDPAPLPRIGIVGEIYVKFNPFANGYIADWLMSQGVEPEVPPLVNFFLTTFITEHYNWKNFVEENNLMRLQGLRLAEGFVDHHINRVNRILEKVKQPTPGIHRIRHLADHAEKVIELINQYGESWLIAGDIGSFVETGISDVVCLQPFGCIANHIIAKGMEKKMKETYPDLNILYLDRDSGTSQVNAVNRLDFLVRGAKEAFRTAEKIKKMTARKKQGRQDD